MPSESRLPLFFTPIRASASGNTTVVAADTTKKIKVLSYTFVAGGTVDTIWRSGSTTILSGTMSWVANTGVSTAPGTTYSWIMETAINEALILNLSANVAVGGHLSYYLEE